MHTRRRVRKVVCYAVRDGRLLVFRHRGIPAAGIQVPAGTVRTAEVLAEAAVRELTEETGRDDFGAPREIGVSEHVFDEGDRHELHERHFFLLDASDAVPERWHNFAEGKYWFEFEWLALAEGLELAGSQHEMLPSLTRPRR